MAESRGSSAVVTADDWFSRTDAALLIGLWVVGSWFTFRHVRRPHQLLGGHPSDPDAGGVREPRTGCPQHLHVPQG